MRYNRIFVELLQRVVASRVLKGVLIMNNLNSNQQQALEACLEDASSLLILIQKLLYHPDMPKLIFGAITPLCMFVHESYRFVKDIHPDLVHLLDAEQETSIESSRHRAKLLDSNLHSLDEAVNELIEIVDEQRAHFTASEQRLSAFLDSLIQSDTGLYTLDIPREGYCGVDSHIFTTTHSIMYSFNNGIDLNNTEQENSVTFKLGKAISEYIVSLLLFFQVEIPIVDSTIQLQGTVEMKDIKHESLYERGFLGKLPIEFSAGLMLLLVNLNYTQFILNLLLPSDNVTLLRLKFIMAFHANTNLNAIQNKLRGANLLDEEAQEFFKQILANADSKWLRKRRPLRNLLVHYTIDSRNAASVVAGASRLDIIEEFSQGKSFAEIVELLDTYMVRTSTLLEAGFNLSGDPFWLGRVRD